MLKRSLWNCLHSQRGRNGDINWEAVRVQVKHDKDLDRDQRRQGKSD